MDPRGNIITEVAFTTAPTEAPVWEDISAFVRSSSIVRGRGSELEQIQPGTNSLVLNNNDRTFDPSYTQGPHYGYLLPMRRIRQRIARGGYSLGTDTLTVSGNEVTDAIREASGDGRPGIGLDFYGGFETGNDAEWTSIQAADYPVQFNIVTNPARDGDFAAKFTVRSGDTVSGGERVELVRSTPVARDGDEFFYAWSSYFPSDWHDNDGASQFKIFMQLHDSSSTGPPNFSFRAKAGNFTLLRNTGTVDAGGDGTSVSTDTLVTGFQKATWNDFAVQIRWRTASTGLIRVWHKLQTETTYTLVHEATAIPTLQSTGAGPATSDAYLKLGLYRNISPDTYTDILYHDSFRVGRTFGDVVKGVSSPDSTYGIWPGTTNYILQGNAQGGGDWISVGSASVTLKTGDFVFPDASSSYALVTTNGAAIGEGGRVRRTISEAGGQTYVGSIFARLEPGQQNMQARVYLVVSYSDATSDTGTMAFYDLNEITERLHAPAVVSNGAKTVASVRIAVETTVVAQARSWRMGGAQIEVGTVATPYVHTAGSSLSRSAARVQLPVGAVAGLSGSQGWVAMSMRMGFNSNSDTPASTPYAFRWRVDDSNEIRLRYDTTAKTWVARRVSGGTGTNATAAVSHFPRGGDQFVIVAWTSTAIKVSVDGVAFVSAADTNLPALGNAVFDVGSSVGANNWLHGDVHWFATGTGTVSDADALSLYTKYSLYGSDPIPSDYVFPATSVPVASWWASNASYFENDDAHLFNGYVESWTQGWPDRLFQSEVTVPAVDAFKVLNLATQPTSSPNVEEYPDVVSFDEPTWYGRLGEPAGTKVVHHVRRKRKRRKGETRKHYRRHGFDRWNTVITESEAEGVSGPAGTYINTPLLGEPGGVLGDTDTSVRFRAAQSEYAVVQFEADDLKGLTAVTLEALVKLATDTSGYPLFLYGIDAAPTTSYVFLRYNAGSNRFQFGGATSGFSFGVFSEPGVTVGTWYYLAGSWTQGGMPTFFVNDTVYTNTDSGVSFSSSGTPGLYIGVANISGLTDYWDGWIDEPALYETSLSTDRRSAHYISSQRGYAQSNTGTRIANAIAGGGLFVPTSLDDGERQVLPVRQFGQTTLQPVDEAVEVEGGPSLFFISGNGTATFFDRGYREKAFHSQSQATIGDSDEDDVPMIDASVSNGEELLFNQVRIEASGGETQEANDTSSQATYFPRTLEQSGVLMTNDADALEEAEDLLSRYKDVAQRFRTVSIDCMNDAAAGQAILRELGDKITVSRRPNQGEAITQSAWIEQIQHDINFEAGTWFTTFGLSALASPPVVSQVSVLDLEQAAAPALRQRLLGVSGPGSTPIIHGGSKVRPVRLRR